MPKYSKMDFFENRYYNVTRICMSLIGLWPYTKPKTKLTRLLFVNVLVLFMFVAQVGKILTLEFEDDNLVVEVFTNFIIFISFIAMYYNVLFNTSKIHKLLNDIKNDWLEGEGTREFEVMKEYAEKSRIFSLLILVLYYISLLSITFLPALPIILDTLRPSKETRVRTLPFPVLVFIDEQENYFLIASISAFMVSILGLIAISSYSLFMIFVQHLCGMFYVVGNLLETAFNGKNSMITDRFDNECYAKVIFSVKYHKRALKFEADINSIYEIIYFFLTIICLFSLIFQFLRVLQTDSFEAKHLKRTILMIIQITANIAILFATCQMGQKVIDHSTSLVDKAFDTPWYVLSKRLQVSVWFMMARSMKPSYIYIGKSFILSVKLFASMVQTSLSYAMVVYSLR